MLEAAAIVLVGLLAGTEFIVRWGVQPAIRALDDRAHVAARVKLVHRLRVVVPALMVPAVVTSVAEALVDGGGWRWGAVGALVAFLLLAFLGTVPINMKVSNWRPEEPPHDWRATIIRWERIDVFRSSAAIAALICLALGR
jgi:hypothetical protein